MDTNLAAGLYKKYPKIFSAEVLKHWWGIECDNGWYDIIDNLCGEIQDYCDKNPEAGQVAASQIKEKFGSLRFYYNGGSAPIRNLVEQAENLSEHTCETCGAPGKLNTTGWFKVRCTNHL